MKLKVYEVWGDDNRYTTVEFRNNDEGSIKFQRIHDEEFRIEEAADVTVTEMLEAIELLQGGVIKV